MWMHLPNVSHSVSQLSHDYISFLKPSLVVGAGIAVSKTYNQSGKMNDNEDVLIFLPAAV